MERAKRFELSTTTLARWSSTTELRSPFLKNEAPLLESAFCLQALLFQNIKRFPVFPVELRELHRFVRNGCVGGGVLFSARLHVAGDGS